MKDALISSIEAREARVGVVGLGYVGLPLAIEFAKGGFPVLGFDVDAEKCAALRQGDSYIRHIPGEIIAGCFGEDGRATATTDFARIGECQAVLICVPTPLTHHRDPDLSYVESTARFISPHLAPGTIVILESTTYPGTTEEVLAPLLEQGSGMSAGSDFFVAYSPEREDPNNKDFSTSTIPKVVGGLTPASLAVARALYNTVICETIPVSNCRTAEATKLMENIFRCINIALVNELKTVFTEMDIDVWEVINAARTKPFGYMPFYPGPGLGGHCIPIDPFYLTWKAREYEVNTRFIELAGEVNTSMPRYVIHRTMEALNEQGRALRGSRILLVGLAYKKNVDDTRESPSLVLWDLLRRYGAEVDYYDPFLPRVPRMREYSHLSGQAGVDWEEISGDRFDGALIATAHDCVDHDELARRLPLVVDTRNACRPAPNVVKA